MKTVFLKSHSLFLRGALLAAVMGMSLPVMAKGTPAPEAAKVQKLAAKNGYASKEAVAEAFVRIYAAVDREAMWMMLPPGLRKVLGEQGKKGFQDSACNSMTPESVAQMKLIASKPELMKKAIAKLVKNLEKFMVQEKGRWYLDFLKVAAAGKSEKDLADVKLPERIDHTSGPKVVETYVMTLMFGKLDLAVDAIAPEVRRIYGDKRLKALLAQELRSLPPEVLKQVKLSFIGSEKETIFKNMYATYKKALVKTNGNWYIDLRKMR